ncbi:putative RNA-binding protein Luc7-like 1 isoform X3 [Bolinopsis microptera]
MTAQEQMRKMLDQLMGSGRDGNPESAGVHFTDPTVCRAFMTGLCPHTLFTNTKMDLGECPKVHSEALRADFDEANKKKNYGFEKEALALLDDFLRTCDRKVEAAKKRLEDQELDPESESRANKVHDIAEQIGQKLAKAEQLGNEGNVDESVALLTEIEKLKSEKRQAEEEYRNNLPQPQLQQQKLRVCEICAAYLCLYDNDRSIGGPRVNVGLGVDTSLSKCAPGITLDDHCNAVGKAVVAASKSQKTAQVLADHFGGKLHMGFIQIREKRNVLEKLVDDKSLQQEGTMDRETFTAKSNDYNRQPSRGSNYNNGRSRREYSYSATYRRQRSRSRSSDRSRRNRSRSPRRRSKSRDRRSRSRDRRSRDRRSRSRSGRRSRSPRRRSRDR